MNKSFEVMTFMLAMILSSTFFGVFLNLFGLSFYVSSNVLLNKKEGTSNKTYKLTIFGHCGSYHPNF